MKYFFIFLSFCFYCSFLNAQEIDYEQFKGEKVNLRFAVFINRKSPMINKKERSWFWFRWSC